MIDVHVHLRDGALSAKETIEHGLEVAASCGITALFDMPNTVPTLTTAEAIEERLAYGDKIAQRLGKKLGKKLFYGVYGGVTADMDQLAALVDLYGKMHPSMVGLKMFAGHSTGNMGLVQEELQLAVYRNLHSCGYRGVLAVHCEKESLMRGSLWDPAKPETHGLARPVEAEVASVSDQIAAVRESGFEGTLHICHISTAGAIALVKAARAEGMRITCGATAHHALLNDEQAKTPGNLCKMNPPLRGEEDRKAVFEGLCSGDIDWIESDHAPHTISDKHEGASGIPGFAGTALLLRSLYASGVDEKQMSRLCGERAKEVYGFDWPITIPPLAQLESVLPSLRDAYPWDPFSSINLFHPMS
ncbi:dihydroorotase [Pleomorphochaeta sp. DL1XJH-081]|jgi:dihydroorotase|uniref:dihydroorotase n=1 Tax=Pleomorphochaeta sp. DL1XJH-081 TaxID=3409690 RepID=UPI003BB764CA